MAIKPIEKANTLESFIEVVNALNKLKMNDLVQEMLENDDEYLVLQGYLIKADKELLETSKKLRAQKSEIDVLDERKSLRNAFALLEK